MIRLLLGACLAIVLVAAPAYASNSSLFPQLGIASCPNGQCQLTDPPTVITSTPALIISDMPTGGYAVEHVVTERTTIGFHPVRRIVRVTLRPVRSVGRLVAAPFRLFRCPCN